MDCQASCSACCDDHCSTQCVSVPTTANCTTKCNADCEGSCTATANVTCQEQCQESSYAQCRSELSSDCTTQCQQTTGAIFCNGNYVSAGDVNACVSALNQILTTHITANGTASCSGNECTAQGQVSCAAAPVGSTGDGVLWALGAAVAAVATGVRRRARR
jgi:hypothetical protein